MKFLFLLLSLLVANISYATSKDKCEVGGYFCQKIYQKNTSEKITSINSDGDMFTSTIKYKYKLVKNMEDGRVISSNIENFDIEEVKISIIKKNCASKYSCGLREFERYLSERGTEDTILFNRSFSRSHDKVVKKVLSEFDIDAKPNLIQFLIKGLKEVGKNLKRPLYIEFVAKNGQVMGWIKVISDNNGKLTMSEHLIYDLDYDLQKILVASQGALSRSDFIRDTIYTNHIVKSCIDQIVSFEFSDGTVHEGIKTVCRYDSVTYRH